MNGNRASVIDWVADEAARADANVVHTYIAESEKRENLMSATEMTLLEEAQSIIKGERQESYGKALE